jgi:O-Antigen ligase
MSSPALGSRFALRLGASSLAFTLLLVAVLCLFVSPLVVAAPLVLAALVGMLFRFPVALLGILLAFIPLDYMAIELGKFAGLPHMTLVSACTKEIPFLLLLFILWRRHGYQAAAPDWFLLAFFSLALVRTVFDGFLAGFVTDFSFLISYFVGRVTVLTQKQERRWAGCAVWLAASLSVVGMIEVFILGEGPRTLLYVATDSQSDAGQLTASFHGIGFTGLREAATMVGPNSFGILCMIALIVWWVYSRNPVPGAMIAAGLICSVTRSAWIGTAAAIPLLAFLMNQKRRFLLSVTLALALFAASIPLLGLSDYMLFNTTGQDPSAQGHRDEIWSGVEYAANHPFGSGNEKVSALSLHEDLNAIVFETTYPNFAAEYGVAAVFCFVGSLATALYLLWRMHSQLGRAALGILAGLSVVMIFTLPLLDRRLACWAWFPIGLAVRQTRAAV